MDKEELIEKLEDLEWEDFEVKEAKSEIPKSSWETVSAFSNTTGGWLVFGIKKTGKRYDISGVARFAVININRKEFWQGSLNIIKGEIKEFLKY